MSCPPLGDRPNPKIEPTSVAPELQADFSFFFFYHLSHLGRRRLENKLPKISYFAIGKQKALEGEEVRVTEPPTVMLVGEQGDLTLGPSAQAVRRRENDKMGIYYSF